MPLEDDILRIADRYQPAMRAAFLEAVEDLRGRISAGEMTDLISSGRLLDAIEGLEALPVDRAALTQILADAATAGAGAVGVSFSLINERAVRWAEQYLRDSLKLITDETRLAIRSIILRGQTEGLTVHQQATQIRRIVGLTQRDALAVSRFYEGLVATSPRTADRQADRMRNRLLRARAETIARTETIRASNMGVQMGWTSQIEAGLMSGQLEKIWIATGDDRTCKICAPLHGQTVGVQNAFSIEEEAVTFRRVRDGFVVTETRPLPQPSLEITPPAHPRCRCTIGIRQA